MSKLQALLKREFLEHKNLLRIPLILVGIAVLVKISLLFGNLSFDVNLPEELQLNDDIDSALNAVVTRALNFMNYTIVLVMFIVAIFYSLSSLYNERQDESVLFWRSLPISDELTIASKLAIALVLIPLLILICQTIVAIVFFGFDAFSYLTQYFGNSLGLLFKVLLWSMLPTISWCLLCSGVAKRNPFVLAFVAPIILILIDKLFFNGMVSEVFVINRLTSTSHFTLMPLITGIVFSAVCIFFSVVKRSQRV